MLFIDNKDSVFCNCSVACLLQDKVQQFLNQPERSTSAIKPRKKLNFTKGTTMDRRYGFFRCTKCNKTWESSHVYCTKGTDDVSMLGCKKYHC